MRYGWTLLAEDVTYRQCLPIPSQHFRHFRPGMKRVVLSSLCQRPMNRARKDDKSDLNDWWSNIWDLDRYPRTCFCSWACCVGFIARRRGVCLSYLVYPLLHIAKRMSKSKEVILRTSLNVPVCCENCHFVFEFVTRLSLRADISLLFSGSGIRIVIFF